MARVQLLRPDRFLAVVLATSLILTARCVQVSADSRQTDPDAIVSEELDSRDVNLDMLGCLQRLERRLEGLARSDGADVTRHLRAVAEIRRVVAARNAFPYGVDLLTSDRDIAIATFRDHGIEVH